MLPTRDINVFQENPVGGEATIVHKRTKAPFENHRDNLEEK